MTGISPEPAHRGIARILAVGLIPRIRIDLGLRAAPRKAASFADCDVIPSIGDAVTVYAADATEEGNAIVAGIDEGRELVFLDIDWASVHAT